MSDSLNDSDTDLVSAISRCSKRLKTSSSSAQSLPQYRARTYGGAGAAGSSFADQLCRRRRPVLRDIGFDKGLLPLAGGSDGGSSALQAHLSLKLRESSVTEATDGDGDDTDDDDDEVDETSDDDSGDGKKRKRKAGARYGFGLPQKRHKLGGYKDANDYGSDIESDDGTVEYSDIANDCDESGYDGVGQSSGKDGSEVHLGR